MNIMIDTEIWSFSVKKPAEDKFTSKEEYNKAVEIHEKAKNLIKHAFLRDTIYMSMHQLVEIFHVLSYRGLKMPLQFTKGYIKSLIDAEEIVKVEMTRNDFLEAIQLSSISGIHVWDFLCFIPIRKYIETIFTSDKHFTHKIFRKFGIKIVNPFGSWKTL